MSITFLIGFGVGASNNGGSINTLICLTESSNPFGNTNVQEITAGYVKYLLQH